MSYRTPSPTPSRPAWGIRLCAEIVRLGCEAGVLRDRWEYQCARRVFGGEWWRKRFATLRGLPERWEPVLHLPACRRVPMAHEAYPYEIVDTEVWP